MYNINWSELKKEFYYDNGALIDIFFRNIDPAHWPSLLRWLKGHPNLENVNWYDPQTDKNYDKISEDVFGALKTSNFYIHANLRFDSLVLTVHYYIPDEVECDINPEAIKSQDDFEGLLRILDEIASLVHVSTYTIQPEASDIIIYQRALAER